MRAGSTGYDPQPVVANPERNTTWQEMCQEHACKDFPISRLTNSDWQTIDTKNERLEIVCGNLEETLDMPRRTFSNLGLSISKCCDELFRWFGLEEIGGKYHKSNVLRVHSYRLGKTDEPLSIKIYGDNAANLPEIDPAQIPDALKIDFSRSFSRLADSEDDVVLVSQKLCFQTGYVSSRCRSILCYLDTLRPADATAPALVNVRLSLWAPNLEMDGVEKIAAFNRAVDKMLRLVRVHPKQR